MIGVAPWLSGFFSPPAEKEYELLQAIRHNDVRYRSEKAMARPLIEATCLTFLLPKNLIGQPRIGSTIRGRLQPIYPGEWFLMRV